MTQYNKNSCAGWMDWGSWTNCEVTDIVGETDLEKLSKDHDLHYKVWTRYKTRLCNTGDNTCMKSPTLDRIDTVTENCGKYIVRLAK